MRACSSSCQVSVACLCQIYWFHLQERGAEPKRLNRVQILLCHQADIQSSYETQTAGADDRLCRLFYVESNFLLKSMSLEAIHSCME